MARLKKKMKKMMVTLTRWRSHVVLVVFAVARPVVFAVALAVAFAADLIAVRRARFAAAATARANGDC